MNAAQYTADSVTQGKPNLWTRLRQAWRVLRGAQYLNGVRSASSTTDPEPLPAHAQPAELLQPESNTAPRGATPSSPNRDLQAYNPQALPIAREQWQRGDWVSLASLTLDDLQDHPDRAKLALLAAAGHLQMGCKELGADHLRQAKAWGCSQQLIRQVVIAGVHNSLGKAAAHAGMPERADLHFAASLRTVMPMGSSKQQVELRRESQMAPPALQRFAQET